MQKTVRLSRELSVLAKNPPPGISCHVKEDSVNVLEASIVGLKDTPYESGVFKLEILIPDKYPFDPPQTRFITPVYHPNIDVGGRICLDLLKMPPKGTWKPTVTVSDLLMSIQLLLAEPNPDDPLMVDIAEEFRFNKPEFTRVAKEWTLKHAMQYLPLTNPQGTSLAEEDGKLKKRKLSESTEPAGEAKCSKIEICS